MTYIDFSIKELELMRGWAIRAYKEEPLPKDEEFAFKKLDLMISIRIEEDRELNS